MGDCSAASLPDRGAAPLARACHAPQEKEHLQLQAQQLQAQLAKKGEEAREGNLRLAQLQAALEEKTQALEAAEVRAAHAAAHAAAQLLCVPCMLLRRRPLSAS